MSNPVRAAEGRGVLHLFYRVDHAALRALGPGAGKDLERVLAEQATLTQLHVFSTLGHKSDVMLMAIDEDFSVLRALQTAIDTCDLGPALDLTYSYVSITETSEYTTSPEQFRDDLLAKGTADDEDLARRVTEFADRMATYNDNKLHPAMPEWAVGCFYPMSHRREGSDNWYSLDFEERKRLMHEHGKSGRAYAGRVLQLVSGSTGFDDWEWSVTLFAHDIADVKDIVYTMRYDEASARYAEFGPFIIGLRRTPAELVRELGLVAADA